MAGARGKEATSVDMTKTKLRQDHFAAPISLSVTLGREAFGI
jgi:hypothetical protein